MPPEAAKGYIHTGVLNAGVPYEYEYQDTSFGGSIAFVVDLYFSVIWNQCNYGGVDVQIKQIIFLYFLHTYVSLSLIIVRSSYFARMFSY